MLPADSWPVSTHEIHICWFRLLLSDVTIFPHWLSSYLGSMNIHLSSYILVSSLCIYCVKSAVSIFVCLTAQLMSAPQAPPNCPPGLEYLTMVDQLLVHQKVELLEGAIFADLILWHVCLDSRGYYTSNCVLVSFLPF